jgi:predicted RND superfamily exporter protein
MFSRNPAAQVHSVRDRIEASFERWGHTVSRNPWLTIFLMLILTLGLGSQVFALRFDASDESFLHKNDSVRVTYEAFNRQFGRKGQMLIAIRPPEIFEMGFLETLRALHADLEEVSQVQEVTSLINVRNTYGRENELVVEDLLEEWPADEADLAALRARVLAHPLYRNHLISADGTITAISLKTDTYSSLNRSSDELGGFDDHQEGDAPFITPEEWWVIVGDLREVLDRYRKPDLQIHMTGGPAFDEALMTRMQRDLAITAGISFLSITLLLFVLFRRLAGVVLSMGVVVLALLCAFGTMSVAGVAMTLPMQILPPFLLAVGVCAAVHILVLFFRVWRPGVSREEAIVYALGHSGLAVVMAALTTAGGLASFMTADLAPVGHFGIFGPVGVLFTLVFTLVLLPPLLAVVPMREGVAPRQTPFLAGIDRVLLFLGMTATRHPWKVLFGSAVLVAMGAWGALRLEFSHDPIHWLPEQNPFRVAMELIDREFEGSVSLEILLETDVENGLYSPELLQRIDQLYAYAESLEYDGITIGKSTSVIDILKETHQALNENRPEYYEIPGERELIAQELLLFENSGSDDLEDVVDSKFSMASLTLQIPWVDGMRLAPFIDEVETHCRQVIGDLAQVTMTGATVMFARTFSAVIRSMADSYVLALMIITPLMILLIGSLRGGLISMFPNLTPIILTLGLMKWMGYPLDFSTMMLGAVVLGVAVDDTIHFLHIFHRYFQECGDPSEAVRRTLETTGRAITFTTIVLTVGFLSFMFSSMSNLVKLGFLTAFAVIAAFLADIVLAPALLVLTRRRRAVSVAQE